MKSNVDLSFHNLLTPEDRAKKISEITLSECYFTQPVKIVAVNTEQMTVDVKPLILGRATDGERVDTGVVYNVKYIRIQSGHSAIIIDPTVGDIGVVFVADSDISAVKSTKDYATPLSNRRHSLSDSIYFGGFLNQVPKQYVKFTNNGIEIYSPIKITAIAPDITAKCDNLTAEVTASTDITSNQVNVTAESSINLSAPLIALNGAITANTLNGSGTATINMPLNSTEEITAKGISLSTHKHGGVQTGSGSTGTPT